MGCVDSLPEHFVEIARFSDEETAHEYGLVILSAGAPYWIAEEAGEWGLVVEDKEADHLLHQLELYERESSNWPPEEPELPERGDGALAVMVWLAMLTLGYGISNHWPDLYEAGKVSSEAIAGGEPYRVLTALFLHADIGHLVGNLVFGSVFLYLVARHVGNCLALLMVLLAGGLGNYLNAMIYYPGAHYSIGASTAVFGAVGVLVSLPLGFRLRQVGHTFFSAWTVPFIAGLVFLAWFGTGSENTDTSAHLMGFVAGLPPGVLGGWLAARRGGGEEG